MDRGVGELLPGGHSLKWYRCLTLSPPASTARHGKELRPPAILEFRTQHLSLSSGRGLDFTLGTSVEDQLDASP